METERWREIEQLYHAAREHEPGERNQFLKNVCAHEQVRHEVEALLEHEEQAESFLEAPALEVTAEALAEGRSRSMLGRVLGHYEVVAFLAAGGMGEVYRARDSRIGRDVAVKVLPPGVAATHPERLRLFEQEARAAAAINHANILSIFDVGVQDGAPYVVYELLEGETLRDRLRKGAMPRRKALEYARQIATGLAAAHDKAIVHRDLKPENLFLTRDSRIKILDFGLAKLTVPGDLASEEINEARMMGTPGYLAPEQLRGEVVDHRADIFNSGAILYEMLAGQRLFRGDSTSEVLNAIRNDEPIEVSETDGRFDPGVARLLRRCLEKNPRERIQSAQDLAFDLEDLLAPYETADLPSRWQLGTGIAAALFAIAAAALAFIHFREARPVGSETRTEINTPSTSDSASFALSPDGRQIVFAASGDGPQRLWLRRLDSTTAHSLDGTEGASAPFWSPDNRSIGFFAGGKLKRIDLAGGLPRTLADAPWLGGAWGANGTMNGTILFASASGPLLRIPASGGEPVQATKLPGNQVARFPQFLPGDRQFIFYTPGTPGTAAIYLGSLDSPETKRLAPAEAAGMYSPSGWFLFTRTGTLLAQRLDLARGQVTGDPVTVADGLAHGGISFASAFSVSAAGPIAYRLSSSGRRQMFWFDRSGRALESMGPPDANLSGPRLSPDGRRVAVWRVVEDNQDIWMLDGPRFSRFTFDRGFDRWPIWSPDGRSSVFESDRRKGSFDLYMKASNNAASEQLLLESAVSKFATDWSHDGRFILYFSVDPQTSRDIWVLPTEGDRKPFVFLKTSFNESYGTFSPDGRWVAYMSDESGRYEVYVRPFAKPSEPSTRGARGEWQVSTTGGAYPRWRSDGKELYYIAPDGKLMAAPIMVKRETIEPGTPVPLFQTRILGGGADITSGPQYDVSRDGRFLINTVLDEAAPITLIQNWSPPAK